MANERVLVLKEEFEEEYSDLVSDNLANAHIFVFSTSDEVLQLLKNGSQGTNAANAKISGLFCRDRHADKDFDIKSGWDLAYAGYGRSFSAKTKEQYEKAGIYFSLYSKIKNLYWNGTTWNIYDSGTTELTITYYDFQQRCGRNGHDAVGFTVNDNDWRDSNFDKGVVTYRIYEGTTALKNYSLTSYFRFDNNYDSSDGEQYYYARNIYNY
jgi:hypothetical protein